MIALGSSFIILGAVKDLPYFSYAFFVAILTILDDSTGPSSKCHCEQTEVTPAKISPIPAHLFLPPIVLTAYDYFPRIISSSPLIISVKSCKFLYLSGSC